jgi:predicted regulator of Ras-like GTPase activity (Roadblock/LC7/MglB family)
MSHFDTAISELLAIDGALGAAVVDTETGMVLAQIGSGIDLDSASAATTEIVRAQGRALRSLAVSDQIDDILITLTTQHHIIRPLRSNPEYFLYLVLDRARAHLPVARIRLQDVDAQLSA